jgi:hypothetical protein
MPLNKISFVPGIDKQNSEYGAEGRWIDSDYVRFRYGLPEKTGGWQKFNDSKLVGSTSNILSWSGLTGSPYIGVGTNRKLYVFYGGTFYDITPTRKTSTGKTLTPTNGTRVLTVTDNSHGTAIGNIVTLSSVSGSVGGVAATTIEGQYQVKDVVSANSYTIESPVQFSSTVTATATITYDISTVLPVGFFDYGWGVGTWSASTWGTPRSSSTNTVLPGSWTLDAYGEDLIGVYTNSGVYYWDTSAGTGLRAAAIAGAPTKNTLCLVSEYRHVVLCGTEEIIGDTTSFDPMLVRFSDQDDYTVWEGTATNSAGAQRLTDGTKIVSATRSRNQILIWTDTALHAMQYVGPPYTFGFTQLGSNCGAVGPHCTIDVNGVSFWMSQSAFYMFDGVVKKMPCTVEDFVFTNINQTQMYSVVAALNSQFNEVTWFYATEGNNYVNAAVTYNYLENCWTTSTLARSAWQDRGVYPYPMGCRFDPVDNASNMPVVNGLTDGTSIVFYHEIGSDADGQALVSYITSGYFDIGDGDNVLFIRRVIPDFKYQTGDVEMNILTRLYPASNSEPSSRDPYNITPTTQKVDTRIRGRQVSLNLENSSLNGNWRFGTLRIDVQPDGLR